MQEPKTGRRIVSKTDYAKVQGQLAGCTLWIFCLLLMCIGCAFVTLCLSFCLLYAIGTLLFDMHKGMDFVAFAFVWIGVIGMLTALFGTGTFQAVQLFRSTIKQLGSINNVVPLTRSNAADIPAPKSLVRASQEPTQAQQTVLLRATTQDTAPSAEQLLRASGKQGQE